jgi:hypothetical protein
MNVSDAIQTKRAIRKFQDKPLPEDVVRDILNAGRRSQSSKNEQAWQFIAIRDKSILLRPRHPVPEWRKRANRRTRMTNGARGRKRRRVIAS